MRYTKKPSDRDPGNSMVIVEEDEENSEERSRFKTPPNEKNIGNIGKFSTAAKTSDRRVTTYEKKMSFGRASPNKRLSVL